ncbi:Peroxiredoxin [Thermobacillus composti KWC4]|jgi:thiol-disulfide isomerase/thioredoxin|uniref:Peroxiredoxin n=1 Tax=Thermobacillus composti (strain DSM 18247 / JCM 13945 / KWC4) TaxID=717605 RepID=L0EDX9_THECK|nr:redoxin family protein [Thermobacillus composti]AGA58022.1 Peroxiredoxin [Thermobacillus composti KWC4]
MKGRERKMIQYVILIGILLLGGYAVGKTLFVSDDDKPKIGGRPPSFENVADIEGNLHSLDDYKGKPVVINFWGSFCPPCVAEMPAIDRQYLKYRDQGLVVLAINLSEDDITVRDFLKRFDLHYTILRDKNRMIEKKYALRSYPTTFFISRDGRIQDIKVGGMTEEDIEQRILKLMEA